MVFVWIYGLFNGGYHYALKMYIYEKVRARNFARAWGFAQFSMSIPNAIGIPALGKYLLYFGMEKIGSTYVHRIIFLQKK